MKTDENDGKQMVEFVAQICEKFPDRYSGTESEHQAQLWIKEQLDEFCDETFVDPFEVRPGLYPVGLVKVAAFFLAVAPIFVPFRFPYTILPFLLSAFGFTVLLTHLFGQQEWVGFLFPKAISHNAFGIVKPTGEVKWRVVVEGHTDAAVQMHMVEFEGKPPLWKFFFGIVHIFLTPVISLVKFFTQWLDPPHVYWEWGPLAWTTVDFFYFVPFVVTYPLFFWVVRGFTGDKIVPGANDNLSGAAVAVWLGKYFSNPEHRLRNVELWVGSQGSEETGDQGARAFVEKYGPKGVLDNAYALVPDSAGAGERMLLVRRDRMHGVTHQAEILERIQKAHGEAQSEWPDILPMEVDDLPFGSSDACRYIKAGYKASMLIVTLKDSKKPVHWHSIDDSPENLDPKVLRSVLETYVRFVENLDKEFDERD
ncbi:MAG: M28 family peptidase [Promethearchaeota archaeon]